MKICFIGNCGHSLRTYNEMKECPDAEFVGIAPGSKHENPENLIIDDIKIFNSYHDMIDVTSPDVAVIAPVFGLISDIVKYCAERKIDVFSEKPFAANLTELDEVMNTVEKNNIHFSAMHFLRFTPSFYHAQKMVQFGAVGDIRMITAQKSYKYGTRPNWYKDRNFYPGTIPWVGIHAIDWICFFSKRSFKSVKACHFGNPEMAALCQYELDGNVIASANIDYLRPESAPTHGDDRVRIAGTKGVVEVFEDGFTVINESGVKTYKPEDAPLLAYDFLLNKEEITAEEIFAVTKAAILSRESADKNSIIQFV